MHDKDKLYAQHTQIDSSNSKPPTKMSFSAGEGEVGLPPLALSLAVEVSIALPRSDLSRGDSGATSCPWLTVGDRGQHSSVRI